MTGSILRPVQVAYHVPDPEAAAMLELYEPGKGLRRFYEFVRNESQDWDGSEPVRCLGK